MTTDRYLSKDHDRINLAQRQRRAGMIRVDYMPGPEAVAILQARRAQERPGTPQATNSAILDAILSEWAELTGIKYRPKSKPMASATRPELSGHKHARSNNSSRSADPGRFAGAGAKESGQTRQVSATRVPCDARRRRDGLPCQALSVAGKRRCKWHSGASTGPKSDEARVPSLACLRQRVRQKFPVNRHPASDLAPIG